MQSRFVPDIFLCYSLTVSYTCIDIWNITDLKYTFIPNEIYYARASLFRKKKKGKMLII